MAKPIEKFEMLLERAERMIKLYKWLAPLKFGKEKEQIPDEKIQDILRSALVLSVSAFNSYFSDKFVEKISGYLKKHGPTNDLVSFLEKAGVDLKIALELLHTDRPLRRIRTYTERYMETYVTQEFRKIDNLYKSFGITNLTKNAAKKTKIKTIEKTIREGISRRHKIVHRGDLNSRRAAVSITPSYVEKRIKFMKKFVSECDEIINSATK